MESHEVVEQFERTYGATRLNLKGVSEELALEPPGEDANSINWIVGHILAYRSRMLRSLAAEPPVGEETIAPYTGQGDVGWTPEGAVPLDRLGELLGESQARLAGRLESLGTGAASGPPVETDLSFYHFHEAYHVGQIGLARRCLGLPGVIEPSDAPGGTE